MMIYRISLALVFFWALLLGSAAYLANPKYVVNRYPALPTVTFLSVSKPPRKPKLWHPPHVLKTWTSRYQGRIFRVTQLPRCEHLETVITYNPAGETLRKARLRVGGVAALSGSFHNSRSRSIADFFQREGHLYVGARTGRYLLAIRADGLINLTGDYSSHKRKPGVTAIALGQRLLPLTRDGFSTSFMNEVTDRMAIGLNAHFVFIVQGKSDIWKLSGFFGHKLPATIAVNSDGGHVVRGRAPVHIIFRWKQKGISRSTLNTK